MDIHQSLDLILPKITSKDFLDNRSLGNEIGFYIFDYDPKHELLVRDHIQYLLKELNGPVHAIPTIHFDLYELALEVLKRKNVLDKIAPEEARVGSESILKRIAPILKPENFIELIQAQITEEVQLVFISGVGKAYPLMRSHHVLNNLHSVIKTQPLIMFFPGEYDQRELKLFGSFKDDNYYRAFSLIS